MAQCFDLWFVCNTTPSCQRLATFTENTILSEGAGRSGQRPREGVGSMVVTSERRRCRWEKNEGSDHEREKERSKESRNAERKGQGEAKVLKKGENQERYKNGLT